MIKFCYNPSTRHFIDCGSYSDHATRLYNAGQQKSFDKFIRGIVDGDCLYLRTFYPAGVDFYDDNLTVDKINRVSLYYLKENERGIIALVLRRYGIKIARIIFNAENGLLRDALGARII